MSLSIYFLLEAIPTVIMTGFIRRFSLFAFVVNEFPPFRRLFSLKFVKADH